VIIAKYIYLVETTCLNGVSAKDTLSKSDNEPLFEPTKKSVDINFSLDMFCRGSHVKKVVKSWYL
jgi:hypothetical protein